MSQLLPNEDYPDETETPPRFKSPRSDAQKALVAAALAGVDTAPVRRALASAVPHVILIETPTHAWSQALAEEIGAVYNDVSTSAVVELKKDGNVWTVGWMLKRLGEGRHQVFCTAEPQTMLPSLVHAALDVRLTLPAIDGKVVQRAIREFSGKSLRGPLEVDVSRLDFRELQLTLRPGSTARDCVARLRQALDYAASNPNLRPNTNPALEELPLPADTAAWAYDTLAELKAVKDGMLAPDVLRHGVLVGPPGTGKSLLAGSLAKSAGWSFHKASVGEWFNSSDGHLGGMSKACVNFFDTILADDCSLALLDEIDSAPSRASLDSRDLQWWVPFVNLLLTQMDRLRQSGKRVLFLGATNYPTRLDPALTRFGRLEQRVEVREPQTEKEIAAIFAHYLRDDIGPAEISMLARYSSGATPATIDGWVRAARAAARVQQRPLAAEDVLAVIAPPETRSETELHAVAIHEAGHAVVARALGIEVSSVSLIAQGATGGLTRTTPLSNFPNRDELERMVTVLLAGRAADLVLGNKGAHAGAATDLEMATTTLLRGRYMLGLYDTLGRREQLTVDHADAVEEVLQRLLAEAIGVVTKHEPAVLALTAELRERRLLTGAELDAAIKPLMGGAAKKKRSMPRSAAPAGALKSGRDSQHSSNGEASNGFLA